MRCWEALMRAALSVLYHQHSWSCLIFGVVRKRLVMGHLIGLPSKMSRLRPDHVHVHKFRESSGQPAELY